MTRRQGRRGPGVRRGEQLTTRRRPPARRRWVTTPRRCSHPHHHDARARRPPEGFDHGGRNLRDGWAPRSPSREYFSDEGPERVPLVCVVGGRRRRVARSSRRRIAVRLVGAKARTLTPVDSPVFPVWPRRPFSAPRSRANHCAQGVSSVWPKARSSGRRSRPLTPVDSLVFPSGPRRVASRYRRRMLRRGATGCDPSTERVTAHAPHGLCTAGVTGRGVCSVDCNGCSPSTPRTPAARTPAAHPGARCGYDPSPSAERRIAGACSGCSLNARRVATRA